MLALGDSFLKEHMDEIEQASKEGKKFAEAIHPYEADPVMIGQETDYTVERRKWRGKVEDEKEKAEDPGGVEYRPFGLWWNNKTGRVK